MNKIAVVEFQLFIHECFWAPPLFLALFKPLGIEYEWDRRDSCPSAASILGRATVNRQVRWSVLLMSGSMLNTKQAGKGIKGIWLWWPVRASLRR